MIYIVSYDLGQPQRDYEDLRKKIQSYGIWAKPLESLWLIKTNETASSIMEKLKTSIDKDDKLLIIEVKNHWSGLHLSDEVVKWMKNEIR